MGRLKKLALTLCAVAAVGTTLALLLRASAPQVPSDTWSPTGDLATSRAGSAVALLRDGRGLVTGGTDGTAVTSTAERYSPAAGSFLATPAMQDSRANHSATLLADGRVLVAGGVGADGHALASAEIYDGMSNSWTPVAPLYRARAGQTATLLADGRVLMAGGDDAGAAIDSLEVFDPVAGVFSQLASTLSSPRTGHAAALLGDGRVLLVGGFNGTNALASTDVFDATGGDTVSSGPSLGTARAGASATTLLDGTVFVAGGANDTAELGTTEIFNPATNAFAPGATLAVARQRHQAFLLPHNNNVLIVGGTQGGNAVATAELYQPWNYTMLPAGAPSVARAWTAGSALSYPADKTIRTGPNDGLLLLAGGSAKADASSPVKSAELYGFATVKTDKEDYAPGTTVTITGSGWQPGETVALTLVEQPLLDTHPLLPVTADGNGNITSTEFVPDAHDVGITFSLTAYGSTSQAQTTFRDNISASKIPTVGPQTLSPVPAGNSATYSVTVSFSGGGANCTTVLSTSGLPGGAAASFAPVPSGNPANTITTAGADVTTTLTVSTTAGMAPGTTTFTITASGGTCGGSASTNAAGTGGNAANPTLAVSKANQTISFGTPGAKTYGDPNFAVTATASSGLVVSFASQTASVCAVTGTSVHIVSQGTCTIRASQAGNANYNAAPDVDQSFTVNKKPVTVSFTAADKTYDGNNTATVSACVIATGKVGSDDVTCTVAGGTFASANASASAQTVSATATLGGAAVSNYTVTNPVTTTAKINKAAATIVVTPYTVTYDGHPHTATITSITGVNGETGATVGTVDVGNTTHTNASTYASDTWSFTGAANYQDIAPTTITDTINKATATVVVTPYTVTYDGQPHTAAITSITGVNGETGATVGTVNVANTTHTNAGTYVSDTWSFTGAANYQNITPTTITDTINKAIATVVVTPYTVTYDGQSHTATITSITGINGETGATVGSVDVSNTTHAAAGIYASDSWSFTGAANYQNIAATTITDTINKATAAVVVTPYSVTYDGLPHTAAITSITGVNGETGATVGSVDVSDTTHTNAGAYASDFWTFTGTANYQSIGATTITDTINQAATSTSVASDHNPAATGQLITYTATVTSGSGVPTGTVTFYDGATVLGTGALDVTGHATFATSSLTVGTHPISAAYGGSLNFSGSPSSALSQVVDTPPAAAADAFSIFQDTTLATGAPGVLANDNDAESASQTLTAVLVSAPTPATTSAFTLNANGSFTYTPAPGFTGTDSFTYKPFDGVLNGNTVTVSLTVLATGASPVAEADAYHTTKDTPLNVPAVDGVLNNDHSTLPITAVLVAGPAHASAFALNADGSFSYTPNTGFAGFDSFSYKANDGSTDSNVQQVLIAVVAPAATLVASNDSYTVDQDGTLVKTAAQGVLANDTGASGAELLLAPLYGTVALATDGSFTYTPAAGFNGVDSFLYRAVSDPDASNVAMVSIRVRATATFSNLSAPTIVYGTAMTTLSGKITAGSMVPPNTEHVSITLNGVTQDATIQSDGAFSTDFDTDALDVAHSTYTINWQYDGDTTFTPASTTTSLTVNKATATVVVTPYTVTYDGQPHMATITSITGVNGETGATVGTVDVSNTMHTSAGTYASDTWTFTGTANYHDIAATTITDTINKATATVVVAPYTVTYDGQPHTAAVTSITGVNSETGATVGTVDVANTTHTNAGTYAGDTWSFTGAANYHDIAATTITDTINKATATVVVAPYTVTYDGQPHTATITSITGVNGETGATVGTVDVANTTHTNAGTYAGDAWSFTGAANYHDIAATTITDTINKATATVVVAPYTVTYDGQPHTATITSITGVNGETGATVGTVDVANTTHTNAGTYAGDTWSFTGAANYHDIAATTITDTINKATATVVVAPYTVTYDGQPHTATITSITGVNGETGATVGTVDVANTTHTNAGTYAGDTWSFTGAANYHDIAATTITDTINKATATVVVAPYTVTYDGQPHTAAVTSITGVNSETGATVGTVDVANTTHTNAGTYAGDTWSFTGTANYQNIAATTITDVIQQATATVVVTPYTVTYNGQPHTATITSITGANGETGATVGTVNVANTTHTNAGTYASDTWTFTGAANYRDIAATTITDVINQAGSTTNVAVADVTYDGSPHGGSALVAGVGGLSQILTVHYTGRNGTVYADSVTAPTGAGDYTAGSTFAGDTNHAGSADSKPFTINRAPSSTVVSCPVSVDYSGSPLTPCAAAVSGVGGLALVGTPITYTNNVAKGQATAAYSYAGDVNHTGANGLAHFQIVDSHPIAQAKQVEVIVRPFHDDGDDDDRHDHDEFDRRGHDGHGWDGHVGDDDDTDGEWEHDADNAKAVRITLSATDADSLRLGFSVLTAPTHGRLSRVRKVSCTPDGHGGTLCTARVIYFPQPHNAAGDSFTYQASDGVLNSAPATVTINIVPPFTTFTQGEWGSTSNGQNPGWFLAANFAAVYGAAGSVAIGAGSKTLTFNGAAAIKNFLPAGGKAGVLTASANNPSSSKGGVFAGQVLALQLNVDFSAALKTRSGLGALVLTKGGLKGQTVAQVLTLANNVLGGGALPAGISISDLSDIVSKINDNYDRGKEDDGYLK